MAYTNQVRPICLWNTKDSLEPLVDKKGLIAGWGTIDEGGKEHVSLSHHVEMPIVSQFECLKADPAFRNITSENTFCAGNYLYLYATNYSLFIYRDERYFGLSTFRRLGNLVTGSPCLFLYS